jgi:hypothetical protein
MWSPQLPAGYHVSGGTHAPWSPGRCAVRLRDSHPLRWPVPAAFGCCASSQRRGCRLLHQSRSTPHWHRRQAVPPMWFGLFPVRSPLLRDSSLFLGVLRCFSSPGSLLPKQVPDRASGGLPHSDTSGSQAASASPEHFAAWPRPSSAANAKASTMRSSCGGPRSLPTILLPSAGTDRARPTRASRDDSPWPLAGRVTIARAAPCAYSRTATPPLLAPCGVRCCRTRPTAHRS